MALCLPTACEKMDAMVAAVKFAEMLQPDHNISFGRPQHPRNHTFYEFIDGVHQTQANSLNLGGWIWLFILLVSGFVFHQGGGGFTENVEFAFFCQNILDIMLNTTDLGSSPQRPP